VGRSVEKIQGEKEAYLPLTVTMAITKRVGMGKKGKRNGGKNKRTEKKTGKG